jgi:trimeric autotransporter adhesin
MNIIKKFASLALLSVTASFSVSFNAMADDPVAGATQFSANCTGSNCHNTATPLTSNAAKIYNARNARAWIQSNINSNNSGMRVLSTMTAQQVADVAAYLGNSPSSLSFASTAVGSTAATQTVSVKASLSNSYPISALSVSTSGDFARQGGTCGTAVATGLSCTVIVAFTPTAAGARTGSLSIAHAGTLTPVAIALSGTATGGGAPPPTPAPIASMSPASLTLASTAVGSTSAAQNIAVSNSGNAGLVISSIAASAEFAVVGGTCSPGGTVAAGSGCVVSVAMVPTGAAGARSGTLTVVHNAAGSPGNVGLIGTATAAAAPVASISAALGFGSLNVGSTSTAQTITLSNTGNAALTLGTLSTGSPDFTINGGTCVAGGTVAVAGNCTVNVSFTPTTAGARSANLTMTHNAAGLSSGAGLSGMGVALSAVIGVSPTTLSFSQTLNAASAAQTVTVSNTGNAALVLSALSLSGAQASEYQIATGTTCVAGGSVLANTSCLLKLVFTPTATGARTASLSLTHNASSSPSNIALNGTGTATPQPAISLNAASLTFASQTLGSVSAAQTVTVTNSGAATLTFSGLSLTGVAATDFTRSGTCSAAGALAVGGSCTVGFTFTPGAVGLRSATLSLTSDASNGAAALSLSGTGAAVVAPTLLLNLAPSSLAFGNQSTGVTSTSRSAVLSNAGTGSVSLAGITASAGFAVVHNCGSSLAASATCNLNVTYTPTTSGAASGSVSVASNAVGAPHVLGLSGIGVTASPVLAWLPAAASVAFGDISVGGNPASKSLTLTNQGPGAVSLQQFTLAGAQAADFSLSAGSTCAVNSSLATGASCTVVLAFQPAAVGARGATLQIASSGTNPADVVLSGNGTALAMPSLLLSPLALSFDVTAPATAAAEQTLSLQNNGNAVLRVLSVRVASGAYTVAAAASNACPTAPFDLMPAQICALAVGWSSTLLGSEPGVVEVSSNAAAAPVQVALLGVRQAAAVVLPGAPISPTTAPTAPAAMSNAGGGGCSIARGHSLADPTLWLLTLLAVGVLMLRRKEQ